MEESQEEDNEEEGAKTDYSNMPGFIGEMFRTYQKDVSCIRYALDAMMLEVGSIKNSRSWISAKEEVDAVWTPQLRELFMKESGNTMEQQEKYVEDLLNGLESYMKGNGIGGDADHMSMLELDMIDDDTVGTLTKYQNPKSFIEYAWNAVTSVKTLKEFTGLIKEELEEKQWLMENSESTLLETYPTFGKGELWDMLQDEVLNVYGADTVEKQIAYVDEIMEEVDRMIERNERLKVEEKQRKDKEHEEYMQRLEEEERKQRERMAEVEGSDGDAQDDEQEEEGLVEEEVEEEVYEEEEEVQAPELVVVNAEEMHNENNNIENLATDAAEAMFSSNSSDRPSRSQDSRSPDVTSPSDGAAADGETPRVGDEAPGHGSTC